MKKNISFFIFIVLSISFSNCSKNELVVDDVVKNEPSKAQLVAVEIANSILLSRIQENLNGIISKIDITNFDIIQAFDSDNINYDYIENNLRFTEFQKTIEILGDLIDEFRTKFPKLKNMSLEAEGVFMMAFKEELTNNHSNNSRGGICDQQLNGCINIVDNQFAVGLVGCLGAGIGLSPLAGSVCLFAISAQRYFGTKRCVESYKWCPQK